MKQKGEEENRAQGSEKEKGRVKRNRKKIETGKRTARVGRHEGRKSQRIQGEEGEKKGELERVTRRKEEQKETQGKNESSG